MRALLRRDLLVGEWPRFAVVCALMLFAMFYGAAIGDEQPKWLPFLGLYLGNLFVRLVKPAR